MQLINQFTRPPNYWLVPVVNKISRLISGDNVDEVSQLVFRLTHRRYYAPAHTFIKACVHVIVNSPCKLTFTKCAHLFRYSAFWRFVSYLLCTYQPR